MSAIAPDAAMIEEETTDTDEKSKGKRRKGFKWWHAGVVVAVIAGVALAIWLLLLARERRA